MTVVARRIASVPRRTSVETWQRVMDLVSKEDSEARAELSSIASVASMLIAEEHTKDAPLTISGTGPPVRIYTLHGEEAIEHDLEDESEFAFDPTADDSWLLSLPAADEDVGIAQTALVDAPHVEVRDLSEADRSTPAQKTTSSRREQDLRLDLEELHRP